jgi:hypothetical protein
MHIHTDTFTCLCAYSKKHVDNDHLLLPCTPNPSSRLFPALPGSSRLFPALPGSSRLFPALSYTQSGTPSYTQTTRRHSCSSYPATIPCMPTGTNSTFLALCLSCTYGSVSTFHTDWRSFTSWRSLTSHRRCASALDNAPQRGSPAQFALQLINNALPLAAQGRTDNATPHSALRGVPSRLPCIGSGEAHTFDQFYPFCEGCFDLRGIYVSKSVFVCVSVDGL